VLRKIKWLWFSHACSCQRFRKSANFAVVVAIIATGVRSPILDSLAIVLLFARILQTIIHIGLKQSNQAVAIRFFFFFTQFVCMIRMGIMVASKP
jgi:uncharacterized MAPEG superfamily protein